MKKDIMKFVQRCIVCAQTKGAMIPGSPHPLPIIASPWQEVTVDLVMSLPKIKDIDRVCMVVDRFTKEIVVFPISHSITSEELTCEYCDQVWNIHGTPMNILSDQGPQFISTFIRDLQKALEITTRLATAHHP